MAQQVQDPALGQLRAQENREQGRKAPPQPIMPIATVVAVKVIVTTNFDRLMEQVLGEAGVQPTVISTTDAVQRAMPLCTIHQGPRGLPGCPDQEHRRGRPPCRCQTPEGTARAALVSIRVMHRRRYRVTLPLVLGCASGLLMIWDLYNYHVKVALGWMASDIGPPVWPYEASWIAFVAINTPAYILCLPVFSQFNLQAAPARCPLLFPVAVLWWWWLGRRIDLGLLPSRPFRHRWWASVGFALLALGLYFDAVALLLDDARFWSEYGVGSGLHLLRTAGPILWCLLIAGTLTLCAMRATRSYNAGR